MWIPYKDRDPEENGYYLITVTEADYEDVDIDIDYFCEGVGFWSQDCHEILAWAQIPKPYDEWLDDLPSEDEDDDAWTAYEKIRETEEITADILRRCSKLMKPYMPTEERNC